MSLFCFRGVFASGFTMWLALVAGLPSAVLANVSARNTPPKVSFYAALGDGCCGEDPHPVHGIGTSDGGLLVVGKSQMAGSGWGGFAVKIGAPTPAGMGHIVDRNSPYFSWSLNLGRANTRSVLLNAVEIDGAVFLAGARADGRGRTQMYLAKHALEDGAQIWAMDIPARIANMTGAIEVIRATSEGGLIAGGTIDGPQAGLEGFKSFGNPFGGQAHLVYLSPQQVRSNEAPDSPTWQKTYARYETIKSLQVVPTDASGFVLLVGREGLEPTVVRADEIGNILWERSYQGRFEATDIALHVQDGVHRGYTFTGHGGTDGAIDGQLTRVDLTGRQVWARSFGNPSGGVGVFSGLGTGDPRLIFDECWGVQGLDDGGVVVACGSGIEGCDDIGQPDLRNQCNQDPRRTWRGWVVRFNSEGEILWDSLDSFSQANGGEAPADAASEYVALLPDGGILSVVDQGFGIGVLVFESEDGGTSRPAASGTNPTAQGIDNDADEPEFGADQVYEDGELAEMDVETGCQGSSGSPWNLWSVLLLAGLVFRRRRKTCKIH